METSKHAKALAYAIHELKPYKRYIDAIYLYGSCARGEQKASSDVDLFLQIKESTPPEIIRKMKIAVMSRVYTLPEVDVHVDRMGGFGPVGQFSENLKKEARLIWKRQNEILNKD